MAGAMAATASHRRSLISGIGFASASSATTRFVENA
jgi:hypothetical protein